MSTKRKKQKEGLSGEIDPNALKVDSTNLETGADCHSTLIQSTSIPWSKAKRRVVSFCILAYLAVLFVGPLSNPVASPYLSGPVAKKISPVHRALFLGHGYRFFGPDPSPSHLLVYKGKRDDGSDFEGVFPDRNEQWPRLLYHRWFMLSETVFSENSSLPTPSQFKARMDSYEQRISQFQIANRLSLARELQSEREIENEQYEISRERVKLLGNAIAQEIMRRNDGAKVKLFVQIREIPLAEEVVSGLKLDDESLLSALLPIGQADGQGYQVLNPLDASGEPSSNIGSGGIDFAPSVNFEEVQK